MILALAALIFMQSDKPCPPHWEVAHPSEAKPVIVHGNRNEPQVIQPAKGTWCAPKG